MAYGGILIDSDFLFRTGVCLGGDGHGMCCDAASVLLANASQARHAGVDDFEDSLTGFTYISSYSVTMTGAWRG